MPVGDSASDSVGARVYGDALDFADFNSKLSRRVHDELDSPTFQVEASNYSVGVYYDDDWSVRAYVGYSQVLVKTYRRGHTVIEVRVSYDLDAVLKEIKRQLGRIDELRIKELEKLADEISAEDQP